MRFPYDKSSKWLIQHHADAILRLAGVTGIASWAPLPGEVVQPRQLPDGLVEVRLVGRPDPVLYLIEINTYPDARIPGALLDDLLLTYLDRRVVPEVVTLVLHPRGQQVVPAAVRLESAVGWSSLAVSWRVVNLWELAAADLLPVTDPGLAPWLSLMRYDGPPEVLLRQCKDVIEAKAAESERANLLAVAEMLGALVYNKAMLAAMFRGGKPMIESPVLQDWFREREAATRQRMLLKGLALKFGPVPDDVSAAVRVIDDETRIDELLGVLLTCPTLDAFRAALPQ